MKEGWFALAAILTACGSAGSIRDSAEQRFADPELDARRAAQKGNDALIGINKFTTVVPGIQEDYYILSSKFKISVIEGTSDTVGNDPNSFNARAERYAAAYNKAMLKRLGCNVVEPMAPCSNMISGRRQSKLPAMDVPLEEGRRTQGGPMRK